MKNFRINASLPYISKKGHFLLQNPLAPQIIYCQKLEPQQLYNWGKGYVSFLFQRNSNRNHPVLV